MSEQAAIATKGTLPVSRAGKFLTFLLADEVYGLEILKVREIIGMMAITNVPGTPQHVRGVVNLRGKVIPVVDLRLKFGMMPTEQTEETCIIVISVQGLEMGTIVDKVYEVCDIAEEDIEDAPDLGQDVTTQAILGMGKSNGKVIILLDICTVLVSESDEGGVQL